MVLVSGRDMRRSPWNLARCYYHWGVCHVPKQIDGLAVIDPYCPIQLSTQSVSELSIRTDPNWNRTEHPACMNTHYAVESTWVSNNDVWSHFIPVRFLSSSTIFKRWGKKGIRLDRGCSIRTHAPLQIAKMAQRSMRAVILSSRAGAPK